MKCNFKYIDGCMTCDKCKSKICGPEIKIQKDCLEKQEEKIEPELKQLKTPIETNRLERIKNMGKDIATAVKDIVQLDFSKEEESKRRLDICKSCEHYTGTTCKLCGCFMKNKVRLANSKCPADKW